MLDYDALAQRAVHTGGFTVSLDGSQPPEGFAVADGASGRILVVSTSHEIADAIYAFVVHNGAEFRAGAYLGAWLVGSRLYLDVVELYEDLQTALDAAAARHEQAIFDLASGREIAA